MDSLFHNTTVKFVVMDVGEMSLRDQRQQEFAQKWIERGKFGILNLCPRFGKCRTAILIMKEIKPKKVLIAYPDEKIRKGWENDFQIMDYDTDHVEYTTHLSLKKHVEDRYDLIIIDEIHLLSEAQKKVCVELFKNNKQVLGLTGTLSRNTRADLADDINMHVIAVYPVEKAIEEGVLPDYEINIIKVPLDRQRLHKYSRNVMMSEKKRFDQLSYIIDQMDKKGADPKFMRFGRMRIIQSSWAKTLKTRELLQQHADERILVFCGITKIADDLGIPSYHSNSEDKKVFDDFAVGKGNHLAVVKIGNTGVTYKPLKMVIINYFDSNSENLAQKINRCMSMEYDNPGKKAVIYIISSDEDVELNWLRRALEFFDKHKIKYL